MSQVQQDARGYYIIEPTSGKRMRVLGQDWVFEDQHPDFAAPAAPAAPAVPTMPAAPVMPTVAPVAAPAPAAAPMPVAMPQPTPMPVAAPTPVQMPAVGAPNIGEAVQAAAANMQGGIGSMIGSVGDVADDSYRTIKSDTVVNVEIVDAEVTNAKTDNTPMLKLKLKVCDGEYKGVSFYDNVKFSTESRWKIKRLARVTGFLSADESTITLNSPGELKGKKARVTVMNDEYNGNIQNKVKGSYEMYVDPASVPAAAVVPGVPGAPNWQ